tara:strand:+ start:1466 stop:2665 length:1200 start_codon:yes stop_codon:yes gene_type:complete
LVSPDFPPPLIGGSLVYISTLVNNSKDSFDIITSLTKNKKDEVIEIPDKILRSSFIVDSSNPTRFKLLKMYFYIFFLIPFMVFRTPYKAIIANSGVIGNSILIFLGKLLKIKVICIAYGEELNVPLKSKTFKNILKKNLIKFFYKRATGFIVVCHFCKNLLTNNFGIENNKIDVVASCLSLKKFSEKLNISKKKNSILSVGRLIERKGFHLLIMSVLRLREKIENLTLTIVGQGPKRESLTKIIHENNASDFILLQTEVDDEKLKLIYETSELFVLANHELKNGDTEGCPSVFSEAMLYELPSIGGKYAGVETAIINNENGLVIDMKSESALDKAILQILRNKSLRDNFILNGKKKLLRDHHPEVVGKQFEKSIERFLNDKPAVDFQKKFNSSTPSINI